MEKSLWQIKYTMFSSLYEERLKSFVERFGKEISQRFQRNLFQTLSSFGNLETIKTMAFRKKVAALEYDANFQLL